MNIQVFKTNVERDNLVAIDMDSIVAICDASAFGRPFGDCNYNFMYYLSKGKQIEYFAIQARLVTSAGHSIHACVTFNRDELENVFKRCIRQIKIEDAKDEFTDAEAMWIFMAYLKKTINTPFTNNILTIKKSHDIYNLKPQEA